MKTIKKRSQLLPLILLAGILARVLYLIELPDKPDYAAPAIDAAFHDLWAYSLVTGDTNMPPDCRAAIKSPNPYLRPPGYPCFLASVYTLFGTGCFAPRAVQMILGILSVMLVYAITLRICSPPFAALASFISATYWIFIYYEGELLEPALLVFLVLSSLYTATLWLSAPSFTKAFVCGIFTGLAAITRPNVMLFMPCLFLWMAATLINSRGKTAPPDSPQKKLSPIILFSCMGLLAGIMLPVSSVTLRNLLVSGQVTPVSANAGINLYIGNHEHADGTFNPPQEIGRFASCCDYPAIIHKLERSTGKTLNYSQASKIFARRAADFMLEHPGKTAALIFKKAYLFWAPVEIPHNKVEQYEKLHSPVLRLLPVSFAFILSWAAVAMFFNPVARIKPDTEDKAQHRAVTWLLTLFVLSYFASFLPFFITGQYRVPVIPVLIIFAASAFEALWQIIKKKNFKLAIVLLFVWAGCFSLLSFDFTGLEINASRWHFDRGVAFEGINKPDHAAMEYFEALNVNPNNEKARLNLANLMLEQGLVEQAVAGYLEIIERNPHAAGAFNNLGHAFIQQDRYKEAYIAYRKALEIAPDEPVFLVNIANLLLNKDYPELYNPEQARQYLKKADNNHPSP